MTKIWQFTYNFIVIPFFVTTIYFLSLFNSKIKKGIKDRKKLFENLIINLADIDRKRKTVWFHSSSMGEFEQAKPIIEKLKKEGNVNIVVSFFSPSGYDNSLRYPYADVITYIPLDTSENAKRFLNLIRPNLAVFMRYDIWPNIIWELNRRKIPSFIADATMRANSGRLKPFVKNFHISLYKAITGIFCVSEDDKKNFEKFKIPSEKIIVVGDTRYDRVYSKSIQARDKKLFRDGFFNGKKVFVFGSSWESDEDVIFPAVEKLFKYDKNAVMIVAPHEPTIYHIEKIENYFAKKTASIRFSFINNYNGERVIIIDSIGILLTLYYYADLAYVGGSFKQGVHNVLEPAVYGIPVLFGPKIENSQEALKMVELGAGFVVKNKKQAYRTIRKLLADDKLRKEKGQLFFEHLKTNLGATEKIIKEINQVLKPHYNISLPEAEQE